MAPLTNVRSNNRTISGAETMTSLDAMPAAQAGWRELAKRYDGDDRGTLHRCYLSRSERAAEPSPGPSLRGRGNEVQ